MENGLSPQYVSDQSGKVTATNRRLIHLHLFQGTTKAIQTVVAPILNRDGDVWPIRQHGLQFCKSAQSSSSLSSSFANGLRGERKTAPIASTRTDGRSITVLRASEKAYSNSNSRWSVTAPSPVVRARRLSNCSIRSADSSRCLC